MNFAIHLLRLHGIDLKELLRTRQPSSRLTSCPAPGITPPDLAQLGQVLGVGSREDLLSGFSLLAGEQQEPPWLISIPREITAAIGRLTAEDFEPVGARWALMDTTPMHNSPEELIGFLRRAAELIADTDDILVLHVQESSS